MPNTAVKPLYAESTRLETVREDRELPVKRKRLHREMQAFFVSVYAIFLSQDSNCWVSVSKAS